jgi:CelD/BcsL family acetyltransferase involved in cellulose biosynthesis
MLARSWQNLKFESIHAVKTRGLSSAWEALAKNALQPAGFNSPELLFPILKRLENVKLATVTESENLLFALPLQEKRFFNSNVTSPLLASALPHVTKSAPGQVLQTFLKQQTQPLLLHAIPTDGPFFDALKAHSDQFEVIESWQRAVLKPTGKFEDWMQSNFDQKRRKEFKRLRNRLSEQGNLVTKTLGPKDDTAPFVDDLLRLEAAGWKGKKGTALNSDIKLVKALHEAAAALHASKKLRFWSLQLDGKTVATLYAIVEGPNAWLGKIAYDESYAKYSPGVMIIFDCTESFFAEKKIIQIDSSAIPDHPMIDRIWRERLSMATVFVAPANVSAQRFKLIVGAEKLRIRTRGVVRDFYYKMRGEKRS